MWSTGGTSLFAVNGCWKPGDKAGGKGGGGANFRWKNNLVNGARCCLVLVHTPARTHTHTHRVLPLTPNPFIGSFLAVLKFLFVAAFQKCFSWQAGFQDWIHTEQRQVSQLA